MRFTSRALVAVAFGVFLLVATTLWSTPARAQSVTLNNTAVTRDLPLPGRNQYNWVNFNDCEQNLHLTFPLVLDAAALSTSNYTLQVWAGASGATCSDLTTRSTPGAATQTCWPVTATPPSKSQTLNLTVSLRDILSQYGGATSKVAFTAGTEAVCHEVTSSGPAAINVWFFLTDASSGNLVGTAAQFPVSADLVGPSPPTNVSAGIADTALILNWTPSGDTDTQGYTIYCDPPAGGAAIPDATPAPVTPVDAGFTLVCADGGFSDGGFNEAGDALPGTPLDGGCSEVPNSSSSSSSSSGSSSGTGTTTCPSTVLVPATGTTTSTNEAGQSVTAGSQFINPAYICGSAGSVTSTSSTVANLIDGTYYTVAVAGIDNYGNTGIISTPGCNTPQQVIDFWQEYRGAGGLAGGGFCNVEGVGSQATTAAPIVVFGGWALVTVIRRRRNKK